MENKISFTKLYKAARKAGGKKLFSYNVANNKIPVIILDDKDMLFMSNSPITAAKSVLGAGGIFISESFWDSYKGTKTMEFAIAHELWHLIHSMDVGTTWKIAFCRVLNIEYSPKEKYESAQQADLYAADMLNLSADEYENIRAEIENFGISAWDKKAPTVEELKVMDEVIWKLKFKDNLECITA